MCACASVIFVKSILDNSLNCVSISSTCVLISLKFCVYVHNAFLCFFCIAFSTMLAALYFDDIAVLILV